MSTICCWLIVISRKRINHKDIKGKQALFKKKSVKLCAFLTEPFWKDEVVKASEFYCMSSACIFSAELVLSSCIPCFVGQLLAVIAQIIYVC